MSYLKFSNGLAPSTPATGKTEVFVDSADKLFSQIDDTGLITKFAGAAAFTPGTANYFPKWSATNPRLTATSLLYDDGTNVIASSASARAWGSSGIATPDLFLYRNSANWLEQYNSTNAQSSSLYGTRTDASNYERFTIKHTGSASAITLTTEALGTGVVRKICLMGSSVGIDTLTPSYAGYTRALTLESSGSTGFEGASSRADANGAGITAFEANYRTNSAGHNRIAIFDFSTDGTTVNQRGGAFQLYTKPDGSTSLSVRLRINAAGQCIISSALPLCWGSSGVATPDTFLYRGAAALVGYGGITSSFPGMLRSGAELQFRLADNSAFCAFQGLYDRYGSGTPEGVVTAPIGSIFHRTDGGTGTSVYRKESGAGNTGWVAVSTSTFTGGDVANVIRMTNSTGTPGTGAGMELSFDTASATSYITSYDRGAVVYRNMKIDSAALFLDIAGTTRAYVDASGLRVGSAGYLGWAGSAAASGAVDTGWYRGAAGVIGLQGATSSFPGFNRNAAVMEVKLADGSAFADLKCLGITLTAPAILKGYTVATLPAGVQGAVVFVTDALAPTFLATVVGGGAVVTPVFYNGTNWVS